VGHVNISKHFAYKSNKHSSTTKAAENKRAVTT